MKMIMRKNPLLKPCYQKSLYFNLKFLEFVKKNPNQKF